ncbi:YqjF family protein [Pseudolysinimonas sp.]|jgi:uncharacterized protein YqjF (DUF2071 family)|uniref:YqjF family protein n=1 Tax=Pseudolysinimonas sp. TaxID=2680009 RepID=UPI003783097A
MTSPEPISRTAPPLAGRAIASQRWSDLTFLHWRVDPAIVAPLLPPGVRPDEHDGATWVGLIPFLLDQATLFGSPPVPYVGAFVEVNVRLYGVDDSGRRGVVFRSLEASRLAAVLAARAVFGLPYQWARTSLTHEGDVIRYCSRRHGGGPASRVTARPGERMEADPLADFLTARWGMFTSRGGRTRFLPNEHEPWPVHRAELLELDDELVAAAGLPGVTDRAPDSVLFSPGVVTRFGGPGRGPVGGRD